MLVDPNTGMPIGQGGSDSISALGEALGTQNKGAGVINAVGGTTGMFSPDSFFNHVLDTLPGGTQVMGWNAYRANRTVAKGVKGVDQVSSLNATFNPKYARKMSSYKALGGRDVENATRAFPGGKGYKAGAAYSPFNFLAEYGNKAGARLGRMDLGSSKTATAYKALSSEGKLFARGSISRTMMTAKLGSGAMPANNVMDFLKETDSSLAKRVESFKRTGSRMIPGGQHLPTAPLSAQEASHAMAMSTEGAISGRVTGYMATMSTGESAMGKAIGGAPEYKAYTSGSQAALRHMEGAGIERVSKGAGQQGFKYSVKAGGALEKLGIATTEKVGLKTVGKAAMTKGGMKVAGKLTAALAMQAVPVAGQIVGAVMLADMVTDVAKLGMEGVKSGIDFAKDAVKSYRGTIDKGTMGMGYRDNTVAATSRQRGVSAIQNSRLNARSVLGSEAGAMHAHFG
jgi:hypothetical protein